MNVTAPDWQSGRLSAAKRKLLEKYLRGKVPSLQTTRFAIPARPPNAPIPLSFSQEQVWTHCQFARDIPFYNEFITIYRRAPVNVAVFERCLLEIVRRHEVLRTTFEVLDGRAVQVVHSSPASFPLMVVDLRDLEESSREQQASEVATQHARKAFDLKKGPLFRAILVSLADADHRLYITFHQLIIDAFSAYRILFPELVALYEAFSAGRPSPLPSVPFQYADYAHWQRHSASQESWARHIEFWVKKFSGTVPALPWPSDHPRPAIQSHRGAAQKFSLAPKLLQSLRGFCQREGVSLYMALVAAFAAVLHRYSGQDEIVLGSLSAARKRPEFEKTMGYFVNPFALRIRFSHGLSFRGLLHTVRHEVLEGLAHDDLPFERMLRALEFPLDPSRNPLFQIVLSMQPLLPPTNRQWNLATEDVSNGGSKLDLMIVMDDRGDSLFGPITYNPDLFHAETIFRLIEDWHALLERGIAEPNHQ